MSEIKDTLNKINSRLDTAEEKLSELESEAMETLPNETECLPCSIVIYCSSCSMNGVGNISYRSIVANQSNGRE